MSLSQYQDSHVKTLIVADSRLETDALTDTLLLLEDLLSQLQPGARISGPQARQCLMQALLRLQWLSLRYPLQESQRQTLLQSQSRLRSQLLSQSQ